MPEPRRTAAAATRPGTACPREREVAPHPKKERAVGGRNDQHRPHELIHRRLQQHRQRIDARAEERGLKRVELVADNAPNGAPQALRPRHSERMRGTERAQGQQERARYHAGEDKTVEERRHPSALRLPTRNRRQGLCHTRQQIVRQDEAVANDQSTVIGTALARMDTQAIRTGSDLTPPTEEARYAAANPKGARA